MPSWIALLRAVNVGGTGKLAMAELRAAAGALGFRHARTYIASGNLVFSDDREEDSLVSVLEAELAARAGASLTVLVRSAAELLAARAANPFPDADPAKVAAIFGPGPAPPDPLVGARGHAGEEVRAIGREVWVHYPSGMGRSRLVLPASASGTARNLNTIFALCRLAEDLP